MNQIYRRTENYVGATLIYPFQPTLWQILCIDNQVICFVSNLNTFTVTVLIKLSLYVRLPVNSSNFSFHKNHFRNISNNKQPKLPLPIQLFSGDMHSNEHHFIFIYIEALKLLYFSTRPNFQCGFLKSFSVLWSMFLYLDQCLYPHGLIQTSFRYRVVVLINHLLC